MQQNQTSTHARPTMPAAAPAGDASELLTTKQVAAWIGRKPNTMEIDRMRGRGIPFVKIGKSVRYRRGDVLDFIASHRVVPKGS